LVALALLSSLACTPPPTDQEQGSRAPAFDPLPPRTGEFAPAEGFSGVFDDSTAVELMQLRRQFDEAELAAIREFDAAVDFEGINVAIPSVNFRRQQATADFVESTWTPEEKERAAKSWPIRQQKIDEAEAMLGARTVAVLERFGYAADHLPTVRRRKWVGPAVYGYTGVLPTESRPLLRELRRIWALSAQLSD
jgi:hypothetical protein